MKDFLDFGCLPLTYLMLILCFVFLDLPRGHPGDREWGAGQQEPLRESRDSQLHGPGTLLLHPSHPQQEAAQGHCNRPPQGCQ